MQFHQVNYLCLTLTNYSDIQHVDPVAKVMFVLCSEVWEVRLRFSCRDDAERQDWIKWLMRATEQDFTPQDDSKKSGWSSRLQINSSWDMNWCGIIEVAFSQILCAH